jgi:outer membrane autotransporter protein
MNKSYRSVWNHALGASVAVSEIARPRGSGLGAASAVVLASALLVTAAAAQTIDYVNGENRAAVITLSAGTTASLNTSTGTATQSGAIEGDGGIVKTGAGRLVLGNPVPGSPVINTYAGGTVLNEGTLELTHGQSLGTGTLTINGGTLRGGVTAANDLVVNSSFTVDPLQQPLSPERGLTLNGNIALNTTPTIRFASPPSSVAYLLQVGGVVSGDHGLTIESPTSPTYWGDLDFVGSQSNTYTGLTTVQGSAVLGLLRTGGATSIAGDLLVQGASTVAIGQSEQIADGSTVTVDSVSGPLYGGIRLPGLLFLNPGLTETVGTLNGSGTIDLGSSTLRTGAGNFAGRISEGGISGVGEGTLVKYGPGAFTLSGANTYSGGTRVEGGTLRVANDSAIGTGGLTLDGGTTLDYAAPAITQLANPITLAGTATLNIDAGSVRQNGAIGESGGSRGLVKTGAGALELAAAGSYSGGTDVQLGFVDVATPGALGSGSVHVGAGTGPGSTGLRVGDGVTLAGQAVTSEGFVDVSRAVGGTAIGSLDGSGDVRLGAATLTLGGLDANNAVGGAIQDGGIAGGTGGSIVKTGSGTLTLSGANSYTGTTTVASGRLEAGAANTLSASSAHTVAAGATLALAGLNQTIAALDNGGTVSLVGAAPGTDLTVTGAYVGRGGVLALGTALTATGPSDRLVLDGTGASASGRTTIQITQLGGLGAQTTGSGIEVVAARNGATTTAQSTKDAFTLAGGHVDAGAYQYTLHTADASGAGESWYLRSETTVVDPGTPTTPTDPPTTPTTPTDPATPVTPTPPVTPPATVPTYRTEVPLFAALPQQLRQADLAMLGNLHQRIGDEPVAGAAAPGSRNAWGRVISSSIEVRQQGTVDPSSKGRVEGFQVGTDLFADAHWHAGVYVGQLDGDVRTSGFAGGAWGTVGRNDLRGRYLGAYATWASGSGFYADAVLQAGDHRYTAKPQGNPSVTGKGDSLLASIEVGQSLALGQGWTVEPQLQLIHQRVDLDDVSISGARVQQDGDNGWIARAGVRVKGETTTALGALQPYGRVNLYRASGGTDIARFIGPAAATDIATRTGGSWGEAAGGFTLALNPAWSVYGEVGRLFDIGGNARVRSGLQGSIGLKARW